MAQSVPDTPTIVVIDDHDAFLTLMRDTFETEGYRVVTGSVAGDALRLVRETQPALVILDLVMETQEAGFNVLREMRETPDTAHIPVLLMTANYQFVRERAAEIHALDAETMVKPFDVGALLDCVVALVRIAEPR